MAFGEHLALVASQIQVACCCGSKNQGDKNINKTVKLLPSYSGKHLSLVHTVLLTMQTDRESEPNTLVWRAIKASVKTPLVTFSSVCCYSQSGLHITGLCGAK